MSAVVILPTTGTPEVRSAIESILNQTYPTKCYLVCDGEQYKGKVKTIADNYLGNPNFKVCYLPENVGANEFYGHRVYAAFPHLVNEDYVLFLDQDCWFDINHVQRCVEEIEKNNLDWSYSLRAIVDQDGKNIGFDNCESLGKWAVFSGDYNHIDTNCYCIKREVLIKLSQVWHGGWGQDRVFYNAIRQYFQKYDTTGKYTLNYRLGGNEGSVKKQFFDYGNEIMKQRYNGEFPWQKT